MLVDGFLQLEAAGIMKREVDGAVVHAAFFLGTRDFYARLRDMPEARRARFAMMPVSFTNSLNGDTEARRRDRVRARFINSAMNVTLLGAVTSDGLEDGQMVSGVGGQFDFVQQAFALEGARSIITLRATRRSGSKVVSNIVWSYAQTTIPRQLRDVIVTEYGIADLRGKSDADVIHAMLSIADSRFQGDLLALAKAAGKISSSYEVPAKFRNNTPTRLEHALADALRDALLPAFPFGSDFTPVEQRLLPALEIVEHASVSKVALAKLALRGALAGAQGAPSRDDTLALARLGLERPRRLTHRLHRWLVGAALQVSNGR
jgi:acyl-CoA hydrolase